MSGSFSGSLLDSLAHPAQVNYLDTVDKASRAALLINANRKVQAEQLAGEAFQRSINPDGTPNQTALLSNLAGAGPGAALAAQSSAQAGQTLDQDTFSTHMARLTGASNAAMALWSQHNGVVPQDAVNQEIDQQLPRLGFTPEQIAQAKAQFGPDPVANGNLILRNQAANLSAQQGLLSALPPTGTQNIGSAVVGTAGNAPLSGKPQGPIAPVGQPIGVGMSPEDANSIVNVPYPQGHPNFGQSFPMRKGDMIPLLTTNPPGQQGAQSGATPTSVFKALVGTEGSGPDAVSPKGATGSAQIMEGTFNQYKLPGEKYGNEDDRVAAARRAVDDLWRKYPNDPARVAVGYFSGPDNVAPPGSPTPWIADKSDGTTSTSGYVRNFTSKLGAGTKVAGPGAGSGSASQPPATTTAATTPGVTSPPSATPTGAPASPPAPAFGTAPSAADIELQKKQALQGAQGFQDISDQAVQSRNRSAILGNMLADTTSFTTGPLASRIEALRAIGNRLGMSVDTEGLTAQQSFNKLAAQLANAAGAGSDARLSVNVAANPHQELSPGAVDLMLRQLQGNEDYVQTRARLAAIYPNKKDVSAFENERGLRMDPRAFQYARMTPGEQRQTYKAQLEKSGDLGTVQRSYNWLHNQGLVGD